MEFLAGVKEASAVGISVKEFTAIWEKEQALSQLREESKVMQLKQCPASTAAFPADTNNIVHEIAQLHERQLAGLREDFTLRLEVVKAEMLQVCNGMWNALVATKASLRAAAEKEEEGRKSLLNDLTLYVDKTFNAATETLTAKLAEFGEALTRSERKSQQDQVDLRETLQKLLSQLAERHSHQQQVQLKEQQQKQQIQQQQQQIEHYQQQQQQQQQLLMPGSKQDTQSQNPNKKPTKPVAQQLLRQWQQNQPLQSPQPTPKDGEQQQTQDQQKSSFEAAEGSTRSCWAVRIPKVVSDAASSMAELLAFSTLNGESDVSSSTDGQESTENPWQVVGGPKLQSGSLKSTLESPKPTSKRTSSNASSSSSDRENTSLVVPAQWSVGVGNERLDIKSFAAFNERSPSDNMPSFQKPRLVPDGNSPTALPSLRMFPKDGSTVSIKKVGAMAANGADFVSETFYSKIKPCKVRLRVWFTQRQRLGVHLIVSPGEMDGLHTWPIVFSGTGEVLNEGSGCYTPLWEITPMAVDQPTEDVTLGASIRLATNRNPIDDVTLETLRTKKYVQDEIMTIRWCVHCQSTASSFERVKPPVGMW